MIGQPKWFKIRQYGGWGITPATKEGWIYVLGIILPILFVTSIPSIDPILKQKLVYFWTSLVLFDVLDIMFRLQKDEREIMHEAIAERNASWFMVFSLTFGLMYKAIVSANHEIDLFVLIPLLGGAIIKSLTNIYLRDK